MMQPTVEQIRQLPLTNQKTIPADYLDAMGHMNIQWYVALFDGGAWGILKYFGADVAFMQEQQIGIFALKMHITYLAEVRVNESVSIYSRLVGRSEKRLHKMHFTVNDSQDALAAYVEVLATHVDMRVRRAAPWGSVLAANLDRVIAVHNALDWAAPLCGILAP